MLCRAPRGRCNMSATVWLRVASACRYRKDRRVLRFGLRHPKGKGHGPFEDDFAIHTRDALEPPHAFPKPEHDGFDDHDVTRVDRPPISYALDAREEGKALAVF